MLEFRILGSLEVSDGSRALPLHGQRERALLAYLLLHANEVVPTGRIIDDLWGEEPPRTVASMLHVYVSRLRKVVNQDGVARGLFTQSPGYVLRIDDGQLDVQRFESLAATGKQLLASGDANGAAEKLRAALALWRGPPLADLGHQPWAEPEIARLQESWLATIEDRVDADLQLGRHNDLAVELDKLVADHPDRERLVAQLMLALYRSGRQGEALTVYDSARRALAENLGLEPGSALKRLQRAILEQDPQLEFGGASTGKALRGARIQRRWVIALVAAVLIASATFFAVLFTHSSSAPRALATAPSESVAVIDATSNRLVDAIPVGGRMSGIASGGGSIWVGDVDGRALLRIDPATTKVAQVVSLPVEPTDVAFGPRAVWVSSESAHLVLGIDSRYGVIDRRIHVSQKAYDQGSPFHGAPVAVGPYGLWTGHNVSALSRIDPVRGTVVKQLILDAPVMSLAEGGGEVWVVTTGVAQLVAVDPITNAVDTSTPVAGLGGDVAVGAGAVWVTSWDTDDVWRVDLGTRKPTAIIPVGNGPTGIAFGEGGVWVANYLSGTVSRIDPDTARVTATIHVGKNPLEVAVMHGRVFVTVS